MSDGKQGFSKTHHYIPVFHLKQWCNPGTGKLIRHQRYGAEIDIRSCYPSEVGFETHLNTLKPNQINRHIDNPAIIEDQLAQKVDDPSAQVLIKMIKKGIDTLLLEEKELWADYVLSLLERHPRRLAESEALHTETMEEILNDAEQKYPNMSKPEMEHFFSGSYCKNSSRVNLLKWIDDSDWKAKLAAWTWQILHLGPSCSIKFVLTDQPVVSVKQENEDITFLALSPSDLWIAHRKSEEFDDDMIKHIVCSYNLKQCSESSGFIISQKPLEPDGLHHWEVIFKKYLADQIESKPEAEGRE